MKTSCQRVILVLFKRTELSLYSVLIKIEHFNGHMCSLGTSVYSHEWNKETLPPSKELNTELLSLNRQCGHEMGRY